MVKGFPVVIPICIYFLFVFVVVLVMVFFLLSISCAVVAPRESTGNKNSVARVWGINKRRVKERMCEGQCEEQGMFRASKSRE